MADRGRNPVRSFRLGAVVLLAMAGTAATLVVAEWPLVGQSIARRAAKPQVVALRSPVRAVPVSVRNMFTLAEPDPYVTLPSLMTAGSAAESRRIAQELEDTAPLGGIDEFADFCTRKTRSVNLFSWPGSTTGRFVERAVNRATERAGRLDDVASAGGAELQGVDLSNYGGVAHGPQQADAGEDRPYDLSVRLDLASMPAFTDSSAIGESPNFRVTDRLADQFRRPVPFDATAGNDATLRLGPNSMLRASANGEAPGVIRDYLDLRLEQVWNLGGASSISVGWRHLRGIVSNELPEPTVRQDAILLELKFGF